MLFYQEHKKTCDDGDDDHNHDDDDDDDNAEVPLDADLRSGKSIVHASSPSMCTTNCSVGIQNIMLYCNIKKNTKYKPDYLKRMHFCKIENSASIKCKNCAEVTSADLDRVCLH